MNLTIKDIIVQLEEDIITIIGEPDMNRAIQGIKRLRPSLDTLNKEIIYMVKAADLPDFPTDLLDRLDGIPLLVAGDGHDELERTRTLCQRHGLDVVYCGDKLDCDDLSNKIQDLVMAKQALLARPAALFNTIVRGRGVPYILEIAGELLENPVLLGDGNHRLIGSSTFAPLDDEAWMEYRNTGFCTYEYTRKYKFEAFIEASVKENKAIIGDVNEQFKYRRIFATVVGANRVIGHLAVLEYNRPFTDKDKEICEFICEIIAGEMQASQAGVVATNLMANQLFADLLNGTIQDEALLEKRLAGLRWRLPDTKYLLSVPLDRFSDSFAMIAYLKDTLEHRLDFLETIVMAGNLIVLLGVSKSRGFNTSKFQDLVPYLQEQRLKAGVSHPFENMIDFAKAHKQAQTALNLGAVTENLPGLFLYQDCAVDDLLALSQANLNLDDYCHPALKKLFEYDRDHNTDLLGNLYVYVCNMGNLLHSANELFIHRNTLSYRLNKICEITGCDVHDQSHFISLFVSYKILKLTDSN